MFIKQKHINESRDKCLQMVKMYHNTKDGEILTGEKRGTREGMTDTQFKDAAERAGLGVATPAPDNSEGTWSAQGLVKLLQQGPVICSVQFAARLLGVGLSPSGGHSVVLTAVDDEGVVLQDPWRGQNMRFTLEQFNAMLIRGADQNIWLVTPPPIGRPSSIVFRRESYIRDVLARAFPKTEINVNVETATKTVELQPEAAEVLKFLGPGVDPEVEKFLGMGSDAAAARTERAAATTALSGHGPVTKDKPT
jgi:hypothetical protein